MKASYLLEIATRRLTPLLLLFSLWALLRGHNAPGGGFIGGLMAASAFGFYSISFGPTATRNYLRVDPFMLIGAGVATSLFSGLLAWFFGKPFLTGLWTKLDWAGGLKLGTPLLFDVGVYLTVIGVTVSLLLHLEED